MLTAAPAIETERLRLRAHTYGDLAECAAMWSDPNVTRYISGKPSTLQKTWSGMLAYIGHWELMGFGYWLIEEKATMTFVGEMGLADFKRDISLAMRGLPEFGFALAAHARGKGFATEAGLAVVAWSDANLPFPKTVCLINPENTLSLRVAEKCGYRVFEEVQYNDQAVLLLE
ncbi:MAG: GNAT family N-acetyltransferase, partial [Vulcanimicrobiaceae bacterium]